MLKVGSCFTGIGAWESAFKRLGIEYELQWYFEKDKYPSCSYCAIHGEEESKNKWDITQANPKELENIDVLVYSPPCQAFSVAGKQLGIKDARGMMFYYTLPIIKEKKPKICMMENVKGLTGKKFKDLFQDMLKNLEESGYNNYYKVLNSKDFGIPQNRERIFVISIRKDIDRLEFEFPKPFDNGLRLKDVLEEKVEEKYYINQEKTFDFINKIKKDEKHKQIIKLQSTERLGGIFDTEKSKHQAGSVWNIEGLAPTLDTMQGGYRQPCIMQVGNIVKSDKGFSNPQRGRIYSTEGVSPSLNTVGGGGLEPKILQNEYKKYTIRKLTPLECWRLQGFTDQEFHEAKQALNNSFYKGRDRSNSQLYKQAGNSITVNVLVEIYKKLENYFKEK